MQPYAIVRITAYDCGDAHLVFGLDQQELH